MGQKLSVVVITLDEEEDIRACLESVAWADEIVIGDSGSRDRTLEICREFTDHVYVDEWRGFGAHKNLCVSRTTCPWVLSLDADERVSPGLRDEIRAVLDADGPLDGYRVPRRSYFLGTWIRHGGWYPGYTVRLFRRDRGRFLARAVHEAVTVDGRVGTLRGHLEHYTYRSLSEFVRRMDRYSALAALELHRGGHRFAFRDLCLHPPLTFLKMYLLQRGFLDGAQGLIVAGLYAAYAWVKYAKLWELERKNP